MTGMTLEEIAKKLNCTLSNASLLLRNGSLNGNKKDGHWEVTDDDIWDYMHRQKRRRPPKYILHKGDTFGYWTVLEPDKYNKAGERAVLCRCVCGKERLVLLLALVHKKSESCGCKRHLKQTTVQKEALKNGQRLMDKIHEENVTAGLKRTLNKNSTTGYKGVSFMPKYGTYRAYITVHRKQINLGCFARLEEAVQARKDAEEKYFTPFREKINEIKKKMKDDKKK